MKPELLLDGKHLDLGKRIGKGGEGEVYLTAGDAKAVKVYTLKDTASREAKVRAMAHHGLAANFPLVAFPERAVDHKTGRFAGFTMRVFNGYRQLHELYGVKSRKINFPKADFRFLLRAAANTARAVAQVHASNCVIGDVNHSGIMVSTDATVALIDADSFQFETNGKLYACLVGVPEFTPPELQGKPLGTVRRTREHDHFGLAVAIFQLLFMGRHPYAGRQGGPDLTLDQSIARNQFAYARSSTNGVKPPVGVPTLTDMPDDIAESFEKAFGLEPSKRPNALEWAERLHALEGRLSRCASNTMHFYPTAAKGCPWCRMEASSGAVLFLSSFATGTTSGVAPSNFNLEKAWAAIKSIVIPTDQYLRPQLPALPNEPSAEAKSAKGSVTLNRFMAGGLALAAMVLWASFPDAYLIAIGGLIGALVLFSRKPFAETTWQTQFSEIDRRWDDGIEQWRERLGVNAATKLRAALEGAVQEYRGLDQAKAVALQRLQSDRRNRQLHEFLDRYLISQASIAGIGPAKTMTLASYGIESAADVKQNAIVNLPGFGPATATKLMVWRRQVEARFAYNPSPLPADTLAQAQVEADFASRRKLLADQIAGGQQELAQIVRTLQQRMAAPDPHLGNLAVRRAQLEADLSHLGIAKPYKGPRRPSVPSATVAAPTQSGAYSRTSASTPAASTGVTCPRCGSKMIRRMARRGRSSGRMFWGCSRYPSCTGTRS